MQLRKKTKVRDEFSFIVILVHLKCLNSYFSSRNSPIIKNIFKFFTYLSCKAYAVELIAEDFQ